LHICIQKVSTEISEQGQDEGKAKAHIALAAKFQEGDIT
jgi:hypothetical protein